MKPMCSFTALFDAVRQPSLSVTLRVPTPPEWEPFGLPARHFEKMTLFGIQHLEKMTFFSINHLAKMHFFVYNDLEILHCPQRGG